MPRQLQTLMERFVLRARNCQRPRLCCGLRDDGCLTMLQRSLVEQSKIALRLVKTLARKKQIMFAAMAEYDWQTVLQCIDDGLNPNDEAPNVCSACSSLSLSG
jgi:hypothetical protein